MKTEKIKAISLRANSKNETAQVFMELDDGREYDLISENGESIDHWINMDALDLNTLCSRKME